MNTSETSRARYPLPATPITRFSSREEWMESWTKVGNKASDYESLLHCGFEIPFPSRSNPAHLIEYPQAKDELDQIVHYYGVASEYQRMALSSDDSRHSRHLSREEEEIRINLARKAYQVLCSSFLKRMDRYSNPSFEERGWWISFMFKTQEIVDAMVSFYTPGPSGPFPVKLGFSKGSPEYEVTSKAICEFAKVIYKYERVWKKTLIDQDIKFWIVRMLNSLYKLHIIREYTDDAVTRKALWNIIRHDYPGVRKSEAIKAAARKGEKAAEMLLVYEGFTS